MRGSMPDNTLKLGDFRAIEVSAETPLKARVQQGKWKFFKVMVPPKTGILSVTLKGQRTDNLDLFLFSPIAKDVKQWSVAPRSRFSIEGASVRKPSPGTWRIGVFGARVKAGDFQLVVDTEGSRYVRKDLQVKW